MEDSLSFMDQGTVICLGYISSYGNFEVQSGIASDVENLRSLCSIADQELSEFGEREELQIFLDAARYLTDVYKTTDDAEQIIAECLNKLESSFDQDTFSDCADEITEPQIDSWRKVSQVLHLIYKCCEQEGNARVGTVIDIGVRYMRNAVTDFVNEEGGWGSLGTRQKGDEDISSSIVVVQHEGFMEEKPQVEETAYGSGDAAYTGKDDSLPPEDANESDNAFENSALTSPKNQTPLPLSPLNTPPFSIPSPVNTDDERDSLATPPELVERPLMTESYIQAMGEDELRRVSSTSGNGFEIIESENGGATEAQSITRNIDDARAFEPVAEKPEVQSEEQTEVEEILKESGESTPEVETAEESIFGGYLPHISIGVAAAAALAGFLVLKKNM